MFIAIDTVTSPNIASQTSKECKLTHASSTNVDKVSNSLAEPKNL